MINKKLYTMFGIATICNSGYYQITSRKEGNYTKFLHRLIWENFYGCEVPEGYVIHHRNGDKLCNCILNLQLMSKSEHHKLHNGGENNPFYNRHHSKEFRKKLSELNTGENSPKWKDYARIVKNGTIENKQIYGIKFNGKIIKSSIDEDKLIKWFEREYPNKKLDEEV